MTAAVQFVESWMAALPSVSVNVQLERAPCHTASMCAHLFMHVHALKNMGQQTFHRARSHKGTPVKAHNLEIPS